MPVGRAGSVVVVPRRRRGALEHEVLAALVAAGEPRTAGDLLPDLPAGLAYTTVLTTLARLHGKGAVTRERVGRAYAYSPAADDTTLTARRMHRLLTGGGNRAGVLARFVDQLSPEEEELLARLLTSPGDDG